MKLHIIGKGVVGTATGEGFRKWGHEVVYTDKGSDHNVAAELHFVCTPEEAAPEVVRQLAKRPPAEDIVIRSTVPPGTTDGLSREMGRPLLHNPEFLREKSAEEDFLTRPYGIVGYAGMARTSLIGAAYRAGGVQLHYTDSTTSELVKLATNAHLATLISFWNEVSTIVRAYEANPYKVAQLVGLDQRISTYGRVFLESPYGGTCLAKDIAQLIEATNGHGPARAQLLKAVRDTNSYFGGT